MNNNQKLTGTVLIVVMMAVMFGLHTTFLLVETAEATHSHWTCRLKRHDDYLTIYYSRTRYLTNYRTVSTTCSACSGSSPSSHQQQQAVTDYMKDVYWRHKYPLIGSWSFCHLHRGVRTSSSIPYWVTLSCGGSD